LENKAFIERICNFSGKEVHMSIQRSTNRQAENLKKGIEEGAILHSINRNVVVIKPKAPLLDWVNSLPDNIDDVNKEDVNQDCTTYLIPETYGRDDAVKYIEDIYREIFQIELISWRRDKSSWPKRRTLKMFNDWFELEVHSMVIDTVDEFIAKEDYLWRDDLL
jgi:hypothetical protein